MTTILRALPIAGKRKLLGRMIRFSRTLPQQFNQPLPVMMARLTPMPHPKQETNSKNNHLAPDEVRQLADAVAAWHLFSPVGICLRRSLLRYHFLREVNLPVSIIFGARLKEPEEGGGIGGHAWLTLDGQPYHENPNDYAGFAVMYIYPVDSSQ